MKLNFWQILGVLLMIIGAIGIFLWKKEHPPEANPPAAVPATAPAVTVAP